MMSEERMRMEEQKHSDRTGRIVGAVMEVHRILDNGYLEVSYQRALSIELEMCGIKHVCELEMALGYKGRGIGSRREDQRVLALERIREEEHLDQKQVANLFEAYTFTEQESLKDDVIKCLEARPSVLRAREFREHIGTRI